VVDIYPPPPNVTAIPVTTPPDIVAVARAVFCAAVVPNPIG
jgi:hypothetical protein